MMILMIMAVYSVRPRLAQIDLLGVKRLGIGKQGPVPDCPDYRGQDERETLVGVQVPNGVGRKRDRLAAIMQVPSASTDDRHAQVMGLPVGGTV